MQNAPFWALNCIPEMQSEELNNCEESIEITLLSRKQSTIIYLHYEPLSGQQSCRFRKMLMEQLPDNRMAAEICGLPFVMLMLWCASVCRSA